MPGAAAPRQWVGGIRLVDTSPVAARRPDGQPLAVGRGGLPPRRFGPWWRWRWRWRLRRWLRRSGGLIARPNLLAWRRGLPRRDPHLGHVDDRRFVGALQRIFRGDIRDPVAGDPVDGCTVSAAGPFCLRILQCAAVAEVGVEQDLQVGAQGGQLRPQRRHLVGRLGAQLGGQLTTQLRLHRQLVLAPGRDFPIQLQVIDQLQVPHLGLVRVALPAVEHRNEGAGDCGPQRQDHSELEQFHAIGENQCGTGPHREDQQRRQEHPTRPAAAAPDPGAAGQNGHGLTVPVRGHTACRATPAILG